MEENNEQTYAYENNPSSEELLKIKKKELKELKKKAAKDKAIRLANNAQKRAFRDDKLDKIRLKLKTIKEQMVVYNRLGKIEKDRIDILANIVDCINNDEELIEDIERTRPAEFEEVSQEEIEAEAFEEPQD